MYGLGGMGTLPGGHLTSAACTLRSECAHYGGPTCAVCVQNPHLRVCRYGLVGMDTLPGEDLVEAACTLLDEHARDEARVDLSEQWREFGSVDAEGRQGGPPLSKVGTHLCRACVPVCVVCTRAFLCVSPSLPTHQGSGWAHVFSSHMDTTHTHTHTHSYLAPGRWRS